MLLIRTMKEPRQTLTYFFTEYMMHNAIYRLGTEFMLPMLQITCAIIHTRQFNSVEVHLRTFSIIDFNTDHGRSLVVNDNLKSKLTLRVFFMERL